MNSGKIPSHHGVKEEIKCEYANQTMKLLMERGSVRNFEEKPIPDEILDAVLSTGTRAATGGNLQPYSIIKIRQKETRELLAEMCEQRFMANAPVHLLFCIDWRRLRRWAEIEQAPFTAYQSFRHFWISMQDTIICAQNICTAADSLSLGSVYIGTVMEFFPKIREMFTIPEGVQPVVLLCLGYPKTIPKPRKKLEIETIVHEERYRDLDDDDLLSAFDNKYPEQKVGINEERMELFKKVCSDVDGPEFTRICVERVNQQGYFNPAQRYFGLHYQANSMPLDNLQFINQSKQMGFNWFEDYVLPGKDD